MNTVPHPESIPSRRPVLITAAEWQEKYRFKHPDYCTLTPDNLRAIQVNALEFAADVALEYVVDGLKNQHPAEAILKRITDQIAQIKKEALNLKNKCCP